MTNVILFISDNTVFDRYVLRCVPVASPVACDRVAIDFGRFRFFGGGGVRVGHGTRRLAGLRW